MIVQRRRLLTFKSHSFQSGSELSNYNHLWLIEHHSELLPKLFFYNFATKLNFSCERRRDHHKDSGLLRVQKGSSLNVTKESSDVQTPRLCTCIRVLWEYFGSSGAQRKLITSEIRLNESPHVEPDQVCTRKYTVYCWVVLHCGSQHCEYYPWCNTDL